MKNECKFCGDLRNIEPAKTLWVDDEEIMEWLKACHEKKYFVSFAQVGEDIELFAYNECPICGKQLSGDYYDEMVSLLDA